MSANGIFIPVYAEILDHPKTKKLSKALNISIQCALGGLIFFWENTLKHYPDGFIPEDELYTDDLEKYFGIQKGNEILNYLLSCEFIDRSEDGYELHNWDKYAGKLLDKNESDKERMRRKRLEKKSVREQFANCSRTVREKSRLEEHKDKEEDKESTTNLLLPDPEPGNPSLPLGESDFENPDSEFLEELKSVSQETEAEIGKEPGRFALQETFPGIPMESSAEEKKVKPRAREPNHKKVNEIYEAYPRKAKPDKAKPAITQAIRSLSTERKIELEEAEQVMLDIVNDYAKSPQVKFKLDQAKNGVANYVPYPASWFNAGCWKEDRKEWGYGAPLPTGRGSPVFAGQCALDLEKKPPSEFFAEPGEFLC